MKKIFVVITNGNTWGKAEDLFEAIKNAGGFSSPDRELLMKMVLTEDVNSVRVDEISGGVIYKRDDQIIQLNDKPIKALDFFTERQASKIVMNGLDRLRNKNSEEPLPDNMSKRTLYDIAEKLDFLEYNFED